MQDPDDRGAWYKRPYKTIPSMACVVGILCAVTATATTNLAVGAREAIYSASQRNALGLNYWPDGTMGVVTQGVGQYRFYAANGTSGVRTEGTAVAPGGSKTAVTVTDWKGAYNYLAGGPVYRDPASGLLLLFYHSEIHRGSAVNFYSALGLAISTDAAQLTFRDLGLIVTANVTEEQAPGTVEMCGAPFMVKDGYFHLYFRDQLTNGTAVNLAVARASVGDVVAQAATNGAAPWFKYYNGGFTQPGVGGLSSPLEGGNPSTRWMDVGYNAYLGKYVMAVTQGYPGPNLYLTWSDDGLTWAPRVLLESEAGESFYPTLLGTGADPEVSGQSFYIYYTHSLLGDFNRWTDASLSRRLITFDPVPPLETNALTNAVCVLLLDESVGATAADASGHGNHGTVLGAAAWTNGVAGGGLRLDPAGGDDYVQIAASAALENVQEGSYTLMAWFKALSMPAGGGTANNAAYGIVMKAGYHLGLKYQNGGAFLFDHWLSGNSYSGAASGGGWATGVFHHVVGVLDRTSGKSFVYVNGQLAGSASFAAGAAAREYGTTPWRVGVANPGAGEYRWPAHGVVDDARIYNYAMSSNAVAALYAASVGAPPPAIQALLAGGGGSSNLVLAWSGAAGMLCDVLRATNLQDGVWQPVVENVAMQTPLTVATVQVDGVQGYWKLRKRP